MTSLTNLDIAGTTVTAVGLTSLQPLSSLKTLNVNDACITSDGVLALQSLTSLEVLRIHVSEGLGRPTKERVSPRVRSATVRGLHPSGHVLWDAAQPWDGTLGGVVEAVTDQVDLEPKLVTQLIEAIGSTEMRRKPTGAKWINPRARSQSRPTEERIESVEEFLRRLHDSDSLDHETRVFACDSFSKDHVPKLLDVLHAVTNLQEAGRLHSCGSYLLVRDGLENPEAARELDRMLSHKESAVRSITAYAFNQCGHPFGEDWAPSDEAIEFGLPRLFRLAQDPVASVRMAVADVLGDLAHHHPNRAPEVMPVLVSMLAQDSFAYVNSSIKKIVEVNPAAARASVPQLRRLLENVAFPNESSPSAFRSDILQALCDVARSDPKLAHGVAVDYVGLVRDRRNIGPCLAALVSPENSEAVRTIVHELLDISASDNQKVADSGRRALAVVARAIRDGRVVKP